MTYFQRTNLKRYWQLLKRFHICFLNFVLPIVVFCVHYRQRVTCPFFAHQYLPFRTHPSQVKNVNHTRELDCCESEGLFYLSVIIHPAAVNLVVKTFVLLVCFFQHRFTNSHLLMSQDFTCWEWLLHTGTQGEITSQNPVSD